MQYDDVDWHEGAGVLTVGEYRFAQFKDGWQQLPYLTPVSDPMNRLLDRTLREISK